MEKTAGVKIIAAGVLVFVLSVSSVWAATVATPVFSPGGGTYYTEQTVTITCATAGATIRYTLDGSDPNAGTVYDPNVPVVIDHTLTLMAVAQKAGMTTSLSKTAAYQLKVQTPTFSVSSGTYNTEKTVTIACFTPGAIIHYTTTGVDPNESDPTVASGGSVYVDCSLTLKARAWKGSMAPSNVKSATYQLKVADPNFIPSGGTYHAEQNVVITCTTPGATIRYTLDGSDPNSGTLIPSGSSIYIDHATTLKAKAWKDGMGPSSVKSATYKIVVTTPVFTPDGGTYSTDQNVIITCATLGAAIHYTTNGLDPTESDPVIENGGSIIVSVVPPTVLKARAFKDSLTPSDIKAAVYKDSTIRYSGGTGTQEDPYIIAVKADLEAMAAMLEDYDKCFKLIADIDMAASDPNEDFQIIPSFSGTFDGDGHVIRNITFISDYSVSYAGLFGYTSNATIKNLGVENVNISTAYFGRYNSAGGLVGYMSSGTITNCSSTGSVNFLAYFYYGADPFFYAGGLVGYQASGTITNCNSTATVSSSSSSIGFSSTYAGGLVGYQASGTITNSCSSGSVTSHAAGEGDEIYTGADSYGGGLVGESSGAIMNCCSTGSVTSSAKSFDSTYCYAGGLVGKQNSGVIESSYSMGSILIPDDASYSYAGGLVGQQDSGVIESSYSMGSILIPETSYSYVGGLVGNQADNSTRIEKCYSTGSISVPGGTPYKGGLLGHKEGSSSVINVCFWDIETSGQATSSGGSGRTTSQMKQAANYIGWNTLTEIVWTIDEGIDYPRLAWQNLPGTPLPVQTFSDFVPGIGITSDPYRISSPQQLNIIGLFPEEWDKVFYLENDIDFAGTEPGLFSVIGVGSSQPFSGTFDGNGHVIRNLTYTGGDNYAGLFGYIDNATIKDLSIENVNLSTVGEHIGGLAGYQNAGTILNCCSSGIVSSSVYGIYSDTYNGGLVGYQNRGAISNCFSTVSVVSSGCGSFSFSEAGGLVGRQYLGTITNCYSIGSITSIAYGSYAGGLVGYIISGTITDCFSTGSVNSSGSGSKAGGLIGCQYSGTITNCYSSGLVNSSASSWDSYGGGLVGYQGNSSGAKIEKCYSTGQVSATGIHVYKGGLLAYKEGTSGIVTVCFWDTQTSQTSDGIGNVNPDPAGVTGKTTAQMKTLSTFTSAGWDFASIWDICETTNYPRLQWQIPETDWVCPDGVNIEDLDYFVDQWLESGCDSSNDYCGGVDTDSSGKVDLADFAVLADDWLQDYHTTPDPNSYMWVAGHTGKALSFDGVDDYVKVSGYNGISGANPRTVSVWFKTSTAAWSDSSSLPYNMPLVQWGHDINAGELWMVYLRPDRRACVGVAGGRVNSSTALNDGQWHHLVAVLPQVNGGDPNSRDLLLYVDGSLNCTPEEYAVINTVTTDVPVHIGAKYCYNSGSPYLANANYIQAVIDDMRIYSRALSAVEIVPDAMPETGLVTHWEMNESTGFVAHDSVSGYDGTLMGY